MIPFGGGGGGFGVGREEFSINRPSAVRVCLICQDSRTISRPHFSQVAVMERVRTFSPQRQTISKTLNCSISGFFRLNGGGLRIGARGPLDGVHRVYDLQGIHETVALAHGPDSSVSRVLEYCDRKRARWRVQLLVRSPGHCSKGRNCAFSIRSLQLQRNAESGPDATDAANP
jgi:hypothetical protein